MTTPSPKPERPSDQELIGLLMASHAHLHQFVPLRHNKAHETKALQDRLQSAWERILGL